MTKTSKEPKPKSPFTKAIENLPFWNFEDSPKFTGIYQDTQTLGEKEPFEVNTFAQIESGEMFFLTDSYSIHKAIQKAKIAYEEDFLSKEIVFEIEFLGKVDIAGKPFNKFNIGYTTLDAYNEFYDEDSQKK